MNAVTQQFADAVEAQFKKLSDDVQAALVEAKTANGIIMELEQKMARRGSGDGGEPATMGSEFISAKGAELEGLATGGGRGVIGMQTKATITSGTTSGGALVTPHRDGANILPKRRLTIRQLLNVVNVQSGSVEYPEMTGTTTAADTVAEGASKPESGMSFELKNVPIRTIAHWVPASRQILDDAPQLMGLIDTELRHGLALKEEEQLLYGSGTGANIRGMVTQAASYAAPSGIVATTMLDTIGLAILQASLTDVPPDGIVVHPADWWRMRLLKDGDGKYLLGDPGANVLPVLFGLPVVPTQAMNVDKFLLGAFGEQALYDRWQARVEVSTEHADFFTRNLVAVLCEERVGFAAKRPASLIYGDFGNVA